MLRSFSPAYQIAKPKPEVIAPEEIAKNHALGVADNWDRYISVKIPTKGIDFIKLEAVSVSGFCQPWPRIVYIAQATPAIDIITKTHSRRLNKH